jgi:hypothetical protein
MAHPGGRPLKFKTPQEIRDKAAAYFKACKRNKEPITITGLCIALGTYRDVIMQYEDERGPEFTNAVKDAKQVCQSYAESKLFGQNAAGPIFALKNYGWSDKQEIEHSGEITQNYAIDEKRAKLAKKLAGEIKNDI